MITKLSNSKRKSTKYMPSAKSLANLIPYKPGENGHQGTYNLTLRLKHALDKPLTKPADDAPVGELLLYSTLEGAINREQAPFHEVWDRVDGKVPGGQPPATNINVVFVIGKGYRDLPCLAEGEGGNRD